MKNKNAMTHPPVTHVPSAGAGCRPPGLYTLMCWLSLACGLSLQAFGARVSNLQVLHQRGQSFITFGELTGFTGQYRVYRSTSPISSVTGLTPIATLAQGSGIYKINNQPFVITDLGAPLALGTGLLVYTTAAGGSYYYAVTNSADNSVAAGTNSLSAPVAESYNAVPGAYRYRRDNDKNWYFMWQDYSQWDPQWGYYGHQYYLDNYGGSSENKPLITWLHGKFGGQNNEEPNYVPGGRGAVWVATKDAEWNENVDPYTGKSVPPSFWYGYGSNGKAFNWTEERLVRFLRFVAQDPQWKINSNRIYVSGSSMGGGGALHLAYHYPDFFAAAASQLTWINTAGWLRAWSDWTKLGFGTDFSTPGNASPVESPYGSYWWEGTKWENWIDGTWIVKNRPANVQLPPMGFFFRKDDGVLEMAPFPGFLRELENYKVNYKALWRNGGHKGTNEVAGDAEVLAGYNVLGYAVRFLRNEAYPVFTDNSGSSGYDVQEGERNVRLDWSSQLNDLFTATTADNLVDEPARFAITFKLTNDVAAQTAKVTIRNAQQFKPAPGQPVNWTNVNQSDGSPIASGTVAADAGGLVTFPVAVTWAGTRLTLSPGENTAAFQQGTAANGLVSMEAENYSSKVDRGSHAWTAKDDIAEDSGPGAMQATPDNGTNITSSIASTSPELKYRVNFTKTGTHYIWIRGYTTASENNSVHTGLDGVVPSTSDNIETNTFNTWVWISDSRDGGRVTLNVATAGLHTFSLYMREDGFTADKIVLTTDANYVPAGAGPAESTRTTTGARLAYGQAGTEAGESLRVFPVPASNQLTLTYRAAQPGNVAIALTDARATTRLSLVKSVSQGENHIRMGVGTLPGGLYLLRLRDGARVLTRKVVISH